MWMEAPEEGEEDEWEDEEEPMATDAGAGSLTTTTLATLGQFFGFNTPPFPPGTSQHAEIGSERVWEDVSDDAMDIDDDLPALSPIPDVQVPVSQHGAAMPASNRTTSSPARTVAPTSDQTQSPPPDTSRSQGHDSENEVEDGLSTPWHKFKMLPSAPRDHAFLNRESRGQPSRQFLAKISKEYRLLMTALPGGDGLNATDDVLTSLDKNPLLLSPTRTGRTS